MKRNIELDITSLAYTGQSVGYLDGKVTFVNGGLPGEKVEAHITKFKKSFNQARLRKILVKSPERIPAVCRHFDICGGCTWQDLDYDRQLFYKHKQITDCLQHIGGLSDFPVDPIHPSPERFFYRNKMEFSFHVESNRTDAPDFVFGLHERGRFDSIFDLEECHLQSPLSNRLVNFIRAAARRLSIPIYDLVAHRGFLRFVIVREGKNSGQAMLVLVSGEGEFVAKDAFVSQLKAAFPELTTIIWLVNDQKANIARGQVREVLHGPGFIEESILGLRFRIGPGSFFQTNSRQTENLYRTAIELARITASDHLLDLYCGAGTIGLCAAGQAAQVTGIEIDPDSVAAARINAEINGITNARFFAGTVHQVLADEQLHGTTFDPVMIDPPRAGLEPKALIQLLELQPRRLVYISCNPATFARDAAQLVSAGYALCQVVPFDMFPHTMHIELVSRFEKNG